jgi:signal transduction histidine kinase
MCKNVAVTIGQHSPLLTVLIEDDGRGFDPEKIRQFGNGLINMKNRIEQIGGTYKIEPETGKGTKTFIEIQV